MSGLNQQFTKLSGWKRPHEFESHILRLRYAEARKSKGEIRHSYGVIKSAILNQVCILFIA